MNRNSASHWVRLVRLILAPIAFCLPPLFGQVDAAALAAKYGPPVEQVFELRPGITMAAIYGGHRQICKLDIRPARSGSLIPASLIQEVLNEVLSPLNPGTPTREWAACAGAICMRMTEYANFRTSQAGGDVPPNPEGQTQNSLALIQFKSCEPPKR